MWFRIPRVMCLFRRYRLGCEEHLLGGMRSDDVEELQDPGGVVRNPDLGGGDGKACVFVPITMSQTKAMLHAPPQMLPSAMAITGAGKSMMLPDHLLQRVVVGQRIASVAGQFVDIESGRPYFRPFVCTEDHYTRLFAAISSSASIRRTACQSSEHSSWHRCSW